MKKVNANVNVIESVKTAKISKGCKVVNAENANNISPTRKQTKEIFISYICSKEEISISKFFRLFQTFKTDNPIQYSEFCTAYGLSVEIDYSFEWFVANCPKDGNGKFAKWVKVNENHKANEKAEFNRTTEKGVQYTLVPYVCLRANYEQFMLMFLGVVSEIKRLKREKEAAKRKEEKAAKEAERAAKQNERLLKAVSEMFAEIDALSKEFSLPFDTGVSVYAKTKGFAVSPELRAMLLQKFEENTNKKTSDEILGEIEMNYNLGFITESEYLKQIEDVKKAA